MAELLTKEKQFLKLNEQLDKMAITSGELDKSKTEKRFLTFQKSKGPSTLLRKQGAGDGFMDIQDVTNTLTTIKEQRPTTLNLNKATGGGGETYRTNNKHYGNLTKQISFLSLK